MEDKDESVLMNTEKSVADTEEAKEQKNTNENRRPKRIVLTIVCIIVAILLFWTISMRVNLKGSWQREGSRYSEKYGCFTEVIESFTNDDGKMYLTFLFDRSNSKLLNIEYGTWNYSLLRVITHKDGNNNSSSDLWYIPILNKLINNKNYILKKIKQ